MTDWIVLATYIAGWLIACRLLARYQGDEIPYGLFGLGFTALIWPAIAAVGLFVLPVWLVTRGLDRD